MTNEANTIRCTNDGCLRDNQILYDREGVGEFSKIIRTLSTNGSLEIVERGI